MPQALRFITAAGAYIKPSLALGDAWDNCGMVDLRRYKSICNSQGAGVAQPVPQKPRGGVGMSIGAWEAGDTQKDTPENPCRSSTEGKRLLSQVEVAPRGKNLLFLSQTEVFPLHMNIGNTRGAF